MKWYSFVEFTHALSSIFFGLLLLVVMAAWFTMMFRPEPAWKLLKNAAIAFAIFLVATILLQWFYSAFWHLKQ